MAYDFFGQDEEDLKQNDPMNVSLGQESPVVTGGGQKVEGSGSPKGTRSGQFTNLNQYLDANKSLGFGQKVADRVGTKVQAATGAIDDTDRSFRTESDAGSVDRDDNLIGRIGTDATGLVSNAGDFAKVQKMRDAQYQGPQNFASYGKYGSTLDAVQKAQQATDATQTEGGRKSLLDQEFGSGAGRYDYNAGQKKLDNLLIQNDPASREAFQNQQQQAQAAQQRFQDLNQALDSYAQQNKAKTQATRTATRGAIGIDDTGAVLDSGNGAIQAARAGLDQRVTQEKGNRDTLKQGTYAAGTPKTDADRKTVTGQGYNIGNSWALPENFTTNVGLPAARPDAWRDLNATGPVKEVPVDFSWIQPTKDASHSYLGLNPLSEKYLQFAGDDAFNRETVAGSQDIAKMRALEQLAALDPKALLASEQAGRFSEDAKAGKELWEPYVDKRDIQGIQNDVGAQRSRFATDLGAAAKGFDYTGDPNELYAAGNWDKGEWANTNRQKWLDTVNRIRTQYGLGNVQMPEQYR